MGPEKPGDDKGMFGTKSLTLPHTPLSGAMGILF